MDRTVGGKPVARSCALREIEINFTRRWRRRFYHCRVARPCISIVRTEGAFLDFSLSLSLFRFLLARPPHRREARVFLSRVGSKRGGRGHARVITSRNMDRLGRLGGGTKTRGKIYF